MKKDITLKHPQYQQNRSLLFDIDDNNWNNYQWQLSHSFYSLSDLNHFLKTKNIPIIPGEHTEFPFRITPYQISLIDWKSATSDPVFLQIFPDRREKKSSGKNMDPFNEHELSPVNNTVQRYENRLLITTTNLCSSYCRYCTRKWKWGKPQILSVEEITHIRDYLTDHPEINEVIFSGGDLLMLHPDQIQSIIDPIYNLPGIQIIRIATRILSFLPQKINRQLINVLKKYPGIWYITHFNHENEITNETISAIRILEECSPGLLNQSVLLKNINNHPDTLSRLFLRLTSMMIKPYYLFDCDPVAGAAHYKVSVREGKALMKMIKKKIGGISIPVYVQDTAAKGKIVL